MKQKKKKGQQRQSRPREAIKAMEADYGHLEPEDIIENQKWMLEKFAAQLEAEAAKAEELLKEKQRLEEELKTAQNRRRELEEAISNYFIVAEAVRAVGARGGHRPDEKK